ncbi:prephenate dehydrogenase [Carnobacterium antarcticum]|uniref:Prephenate dehydrogenase n=1 Tax=Carnobacterium antarcticum TaxID=2126436 RepID=A0ABW4NQZ9_9LACT|nr:prephenate dehydrogenase [Carnobacterium sp. CP1]ALV21113.1 hypothetical protein NY10_495 [Carnobacterium sp. CP1]
MTIVLVGLGVIGGSFGLALKEAGYTSVYGIDTNETTLKKAKKLGIIQEGFTDGEEILPQADLIIFSLYPTLIAQFIQSHPKKFKPNAILTDVTGIKQGIIKEISPLLPDSVDFIFGHPMAGREKRGIDFANQAVFKDANYLLTPTVKNQEKNLVFLEQLVKELGFKKVTRITPHEHDQLIGFTSQLPHAIAVALVNSDINEKTGDFVGDSYRELTRIANINEELWSELFIGNKSNLLEAIDLFETELTKIKVAVAENDTKTLKRLFIHSTERRSQL